MGDQLDNLSVIAAFRKRFGAVLPLKGKCKGWARGEASDVSEGTCGVEVMVHGVRKVVDDKNKKFGMTTQNSSV